MGLEAFWAVGGYLCMTHPLKSPYMDIWRWRPFSCLEERVIDLSEGQGHIPYMESHVLLKVKVGHLTTLSPSFYSSIWIWNLKRSHQIYAGLFGKYILYKINSKSKWKNVWNPAKKHCLLWAQVWKFYLIVKVGYYPWISLACTSIHTLFIHCLLSTVIHCW